MANVIEGLLQAGDVHLCVIDSSFKGAAIPPDDRYERTIIRAAELPLGRRAMQRIWTIPNLSYADEPDLRHRIASSVGQQDWDLVWFSRVRVHRLCSDLFDTERILDLDDLNDRLFASLADEQRSRGGLIGRVASVTSRIVANRWRQYYRRLVTGPDQLVVTHDGDRANLGQPSSAIVPNGYRVPDSGPTGIDDDANTLLFVGPLSYEPNYLAVCWLVEEILDRVRARVPGASLAVVGDLDGAPKLPQHEAVRYHDFVDDLEPLYAEAAAVVAPLRSGGGTRIKILEAMARNRPIVATTFAAEGLGLLPSHDLCTADTAEAFADHCADLLTDADLRERLAKQANETFLANHTSANASNAVRSLVGSVLGTGETGPGTEGP